MGFLIAGVIVGGLLGAFRRFAWSKEPVRSKILNRGPFYINGFVALFTFTTFLHAAGEIATVRLAAQQAGLFAEDLFWIVAIYIMGQAAKDTLALLAKAEAANQQTETEQ